MAEKTKEAPTKRPTAQKRDLQNAKRRLQHRSFKSRVKTAIRSFEKDLEENNAAGAKEKLNDVLSLLDKGVKTAVFTRNKASRLKSKFASRV